MTATDDRDNACRVAAPTRGQLGRRALGLEPFYDPQTKEELAGTGGLELAIAIAGAVVGAFVWKVAWNAWPIGGATGLGGGFIVVSTVFATVAWWACLGAVRRRRFRRVADAALARGRCPSCAYDLTGLAPATDGCVVCPECGAAWRSERVRREG